MIARTLASTAVAALLLGGMLTTAHAETTEGFHVESGKIYDGNGQEFVPQGINLPYAWYKDQSQSFADARAAGANTVRVVLSGGRWGTTSTAEVTDIINECKENQLVCILEDHDTTGYGEDSSATSLASSVNFWKGVSSALVGQEDYVMVNIGNEPYGNSGYSSWTSDTTSAITQLRSAGINNTLIVDGPNWGQDWSYTMRDNAAAVAAVDDNLVFDIHMYGVFDTSSSVTSYLDSFTNQNLAIMVGEFADHHASGTPDANTILSYTRSQGIGMLGWSWSGNGGEDAPLDMVQNFDASQLTSWGERFINGTDGLKVRNAQPASVYSSSPGTTPGDPGTAPNGYPYCTSAAVDPDGDGWGWENSASCVVR